MSGRRPDGAVLLAVWFRLKRKAGHPGFRFSGFAGPRPSRVRGLRRFSRRVGSRERVSRRPSRRLPTWLPLFRRSSESAPACQGIQRQSRAVGRPVSYVQRSRGTETALRTSLQEASHNLRNRTGTRYKPATPSAPTSPVRVKLGTHTFRSPSPAPNPISLVARKRRRRGRGRAYLRRRHRGARP
jgi:hypothetical protein